MDRVLSAKDVIIATGSDPFVPPGIETDGRTVFTSDEAINLEWLPRWIAIIGSAISVWNSLMFIRPLVVK